MPNGLNQLTGVSGQAAPVYDANLNLSWYTNWTYIYDADKRLISVNGNGRSAQFVYDGLGRCVKRTIDDAATVYTYDEWKPVVEWTGAGVFVAWNLYGPGADEILVRNQPDPAGYLHYHLDAMGNVVFLLSESSQGMQGLEKYTYDAFGKPAIKGWQGDARSISNYGNRFLFTGREWLKDLKVYDYRNRQYQPELGRFLQPDPKEFEAGDYNLYRYCHNDPVNKSDPTGLYVTYSGDWSEADAQNFSAGFAQAWDNPGERAKWEGRYADASEHRIAPDRSSGTPEEGASRFREVKQVSGLRAVLERILGTVGMGNAPGYSPSKDVRAVLDGRLGRESVSAAERAKAAQYYRNVRTTGQHKEAAKEFNQLRANYLEKGGERPGTLLDYIRRKLGGQ